MASQTNRLKKPSAFKRLFVDCETSPDVVFSWGCGYKVNISPENIVEERALIVISWKWEGEKVIHSLHWDPDTHDDKAMLKAFIPMLEQAHEVVGHNSDRFDLPWIRTRALFHGLLIRPDLVGVDTLKLARKYFRFNSNKLSYITHFLGLDQKIQVGYGLWKDVVWHSSLPALKKMITYCKNDVRITEQAYNKLASYGAIKTHVGVLRGGPKHSCVNCGSVSTQRRGLRVSAAGTHKQALQCNDCGRYFSISETEAKKADG